MLINTQTDLKRGMARESRHQEDYKTENSLSVCKRKCVHHKIWFIDKSAVSLVVQTLTSWIVAKPNQAAKEFQDA